MTCPCLCGRPVKPGKTYATSSCVLRARQAEFSARGLRARWGSVRRSKDWHAGRKVGYMTAWRYWRAWAMREIARQRNANAGAA